MKTLTTRELNRALLARADLEREGRSVLALVAPELRARVRVERG